MSNMSYCRFHNTALDMDDCLDAIDMGERDLSEQEVRAAKRMFKAVAEFLVDEGLVYCEGGYVEVQEGAIDKFFERMAE